MRGDFHQRNSACIYSVSLSIAPQSGAGLYSGRGVYVCGAVVIESFNGHTEYTAGPRSALYLWGTEVEEFLEMVGVALFAGALVRYLSQRLDVLSVSTNFDSRS
ncbi:hypothetical protein GCM10028792_20030 [Salinisphaera aquimarina]